MSKNELQQEYNPMTVRRIEVICSLVEPEKNVICLGCRNNDVITKVLMERTTKLQTLDCANNADIVADLDFGIPLEAESFEYVVAGEIIEHLYDTNHIFSEMHRVLKSGGFLVLSVPNISRLRNRVKMLFGGVPIACAKNEHIRDFNLSLILQHLKQNNFKVVSLKSDGVWVRNKKILPSCLCRTSWGEHIIIKAAKEEINE